MKSFILVLSVLSISDNVLSRKSYSTDPNYDCQHLNTGHPGFCKRFSECKSAQQEWFVGRIYPTICTYNRFDAVVCCLNEEPDPDFLPGHLLIGNNHQLSRPVDGKLQQKSRDTKDQFSSSSGNKQNKTDKLLIDKKQKDSSDCTVIVFQHRHNPIYSPCIIPFPSKNKHNRMRNTQGTRNKDDETNSDEPETFNPTGLKSKELEYKKTRVILSDTNDEPPYLAPIYAYLSLF